MYPLPDIVVLDFCEWLNDKINDVGDELSMADLFTSNGNSLDKYAYEFLANRKNADCPSKDVMTLFFKSEEYHRAAQDCHRYGHRRHESCESCYEQYKWIYCPHIYHAIGSFQQKYDLKSYSSIYEDLSAAHLADRIRDMLLHENTDAEIRKHPSALRLMKNLSGGISEEPQVSLGIQGQKSKWSVRGAGNRARELQDERPIGDTVQSNDSESRSKKLEGFERALQVINDSHELDDQMKAQLVEIVEAAMAGVPEGSSAKQEEAQKAQC